MKIILLRSNNIFASRVQKYINHYERIGVDYLAVGWDRMCEEIQKDNYEFLRYRAGVNIGGIKAIKNHCRWMLYVYFILNNTLKSHLYMHVI